jgi:peroxiredoxin
MTSTQLQKVPQAGDIAPGFAARLTSGNEVTLSEFRGKRKVPLAFSMDLFSDFRRGIGKLA